MYKITYGQGGDNFVILLEKSVRSLHTLFNRPKVLFALADIFSMCLAQDKLFVTVIPKSMVCGTHS